MPEGEEFSEESTCIAASIGSGKNILLHSVVLSVKGLEIQNLKIFRKDKKNGTMKKSNKSCFLNL